MKLYSRRSLNFFFKKWSNIREFLSVVLSSWVYASYTDYHYQIGGEWTFLISMLSIDSHDKNVNDGNNNDNNNNNNFNINDNIKNNDNNNKKQQQKQSHDDDNNKNNNKKQQQKQK